MSSINAYLQVCKYIIVKNGRIFIDICECGCGSGCFYCYAPNHNEQQKLLSIEHISLICKYIKENYDCCNKIISLCPNTEPLKSKESIELITYIINFFSDMGCYIQISTKEIIPQSFLDKIHNLSKSNIYINISIPVIMNSKIIEPNAATVETRFNNFLMKKIYHNINFCLYIKPFILNENDQDFYIKYINRYQIDTVCVGPTFDKNINIPCISLYDKDKAEKMYGTQIDDMNTFIKILRLETKAKVFGSSICCIHSKSYNNCILQLFKYSKEFCKDCNLEWR